MARIEISKRAIDLGIIKAEDAYYETNCVDCGKKIKYSYFAFDSDGQPTGEYAHITASGLCSNTIDGCWEKQAEVETDNEGWLSANDVFGEIQASLDKAYKPKRKE